MTHTCPRCGAPLNVGSNGWELSCEYCGYTRNNMIREPIGSINEIGAEVKIDRWQLDQLTRYYGSAGADEHIRARLIDELKEKLMDAVTISVFENLDFCYGGGLIYKAKLKVIIPDDYERHEQDLYKAYRNALKDNASIRDAFKAMDKIEEARQNRWAMEAIGNLKPMSFDDEDSGQTVLYADGQKYTFDYKK